MSMGGDPMQALQMIRRRGGGWGGANGYPPSRDASFNNGAAPDPYAGVHHPGDPYQGVHHPGDPGDAPPMPNGPGDVNPGPMPTSNPGGGASMGGDAPQFPNSGPGDANQAGQPPANPVLMQLLQNLGKGGGGYGTPPMKPQPITPPAKMQSTLPAVSAIDSPGSTAPGPAEKGGPDNGLPAAPVNPAASTANRIPSRPMQRMRQLQASPY